MVALSVVGLDLLIGSSAGFDVLCLKVSPAHGEFLCIPFCSWFMASGNTDLSTSTVGRQGVDDVG
jgi:hypothetical protein